MKKPVLLMLLLVVQWLCLASAQSNYPLVTFSTDWVTPEKYNSFIASVRATLVSTTKEKSNGIPVLISKDGPPTYLNVTLTNKAGQSISLKMDASEAKFTDYVAGKYSCNIRTGTCFSDPFSSSVAHTQRESSAAAAAGDDGSLGATTTWRANDLDEAISSLFLFAAGRASEQSFRRGVAACEMMIASAAKFRYIQRRLGAGMWYDAGNGVSDDARLNGLLARWPTLSSQVQLSNQGAFPAPVTVDRGNGKTLRVDNVRRAVPIVSFLEHDKCGKKLPRVIRSVVQDAAEMLGRGGAPATATACTPAEPMMYIMGAEGKCVDVADHKYVKEAQVILWPCKSDYHLDNQLWTLKRDGTITINGINGAGTFCLRAKSASAGDRVIIDNCMRTQGQHKVWDVRADGTIALRSDSSLVLAATSAANGTGLTLERDGGGTGQGWTPTNDTAPLVATVLGFRDLYLQVDAAGAVVLLAAPCAGAAAEWALYPDGSIRRASATQQCLAPDAAGRVVATACSVAAAARQRWVFRNDGTVLNSGTGKVMDMRPRLNARPMCGSQGIAMWEVVLSEPVPGSPTQEWVIMV